MSKKRVLHLLSDAGMGWTGGIRVTLENLANSYLGSLYDFQMEYETQAIQQLANLKPDIVVVNSACSWKRLPRLWRLSRSARLVIVEHHYSAGFEQWSVASRWRFRWMLRLSYGLSDRTVAISEGQQDWMVKRRLLSPRKMHLIQSSRNVDAFLQIPLCDRPADRPLVLAAYGRLTRQKGFDVLIAALQQLNDPRIQVKIGGTGPDEAALRQAAAHLPGVEFLGRVDNVPDYLSQCDAVVIPSLWEPWGNVCLEARAAARPVIVAAVDGLPEQVQGCGLVVPPGDPTSLATAIHQLQQQTLQERQQMGLIGRDSVTSAWNRYLRQWEALLSSL